MINVLEVRNIHAYRTYVFAQWLNTKADEAVKAYRAVPFDSRKKVQVSGDMLAYLDAAKCAQNEVERLYKIR